MTLTKEQRERTQKLAEDMFNAFTWSRTKQGSDYWAGIAAELRELAYEETKCSTCGK